MKEKIVKTVTKLCVDALCTSRAAPIWLQVRLEAHAAVTASATQTALQSFVRDSSYRRKYTLLSDLEAEETPQKEE